MNQYRDALQTIGKAVALAENSYQRKPNEVKILAVSKRHSIEAIQALYDCGQKAFGENYTQELVMKAEQLSKLGIEWHFIGPIQSNKTRLIAATADWVHTIDRLKIAERLSQQRPQEREDLSVCIQVNISREASKSGVMPESLRMLAEQIIRLPRLKLRGLMVIPAATSSFELQRSAFAETRKHFDYLNQTLPLSTPMDTLSMGMSGDMDAAIAEGATMVRIGTALFGQRPI